MPWLLDEVMYGSAFRTSIEAVLVPDRQPGDTVVLDNVPPNKVGGIRARAHRSGLRAAALFSNLKPRLHPIERAFAKLKALLRTEAARIIPNLRDAVRPALTRFQPTGCRNYPAAAGYHASSDAALTRKNFRNLKRS